VRQISVIEHERLRLGRVTEQGTEGATLSKVDFDRLRDFDEKSATTRGTTVFEWTAKEASARQWVGVVEVKGLSVEVLPKVAAHGHDLPFARHNLLYMLSVASRVPLRDRDFAQQSAAKMSLLEVLIRAFCTRLLHEIQLGLPHNYETREENLPLIKGKLSLSQHLKFNSMRPDRFYVAYQEFSPDNLINRILRACCQRLVSRARLLKTQEQLRQALVLMDDVADAEITEADFAKIQITRQNERFETLLDFARMVILGNSPTSAKGAVNTFSLLFDMNALFEAFITQFLTRYVLGRGELTGWHLHEQGRGVYPRYLATRQSDQVGVSMMKPDITLFQGKSPSIIIDTKWKTLDDQTSNRKGVSKADFLQMYAYANHFQCEHVVLLYPTILGALRESFDLTRESRKVHMRFVDMSQDLKANRQLLATHLSELVLEFNSLQVHNSN